MYMYLHDPDAVFSSDFRFLAGNSLFALSETSTQRSALKVLTTKLVKVHKVT